MSTISSLSDLVTLQNEGKAFICFFWAVWHELSKPGGQLQDIYSTLGQKYRSIGFYLIEAESATDISEKYGISVVPTFLAFQGSQLRGKLEGANPSELNKLVKALDEASSSSKVTPIVTAKASTDQPDTSLNDRLKKLIHTAQAMLFMKGTPTQPRCGFSRQIVEILQKHGIPFASFDILTDDVVRNGLKALSDWPTYPQLYVNGTLVGGLDIVKEMESSGDLKEQMGVQSVQDTLAREASLQDRLKALITRAKVMLFMKGSPETPRCGFSRTIANILKEEDISFDHFDILSDDEIREGLKTYSDWPTYPQLYVNGTLVGGLDIVNEMRADGSLKQQLGL